MAEHGVIHRAGAKQRAEVSLDFGRHPAEAVGIPLGRELAEVLDGLAAERLRQHFLRVDLSKDELVVDDVRDNQNGVFELLLSNSLSHRHHGAHAKRQRLARTRSVFVNDVGLPLLRRSPHTARLIGLGVVVGEQRSRHHIGRAGVVNHSRVNLGIYRPSVQPGFGQGNHLLLNRCWGINWNLERSVDHFLEHNIRNFPKTFIFRLLFFVPNLRHVGFKCQVPVFFSSLISLSFDLFFRIYFRC